MIQQWNQIGIIMEMVIFGVQHGEIQKFLTDTPV